MVRMLTARGLTLTLLLCALFAVVAIRLWAHNTVSQARLTHARGAIKAERYAEAEQAARAILGDSPDSAEAALIAAEALIGLNRGEEALDVLDRIPNDGSKDFVLAQATAGQILLDLGRATEAEQRFRKVLEIEPQQPFALSRLVLLMALEARRWESLPYLEALIRTDRFSVEDLLFIGNVGALVESKELEFYREAVPDDPRPLLGAAMLALRRNQVDEADRLLRAVIAADPEMLEAHAGLGMMILEHDSPARWAEWIRKLPPSADDHPDIWVVKGLYAQRQQQPEAAVRCFWEALKRDPNQYTATYQISLALATLGEHHWSDRFSRRAAVLKQLAEALQGVFDDQKNIDAMRQCAELTESIGRLWEAWGWYRAILVEAPHAEWARVGRDRVEAELHPELELMLPEYNLARHVDYSSHPTPVIRESAMVASLPSSVSTIRFEDIAVGSGVQFTYFNGDDPLTEGRRMFEFTGGGVGAIDYDLDRWPDIYLTQGCQWPPDPNQKTYLDRMYRNLGGEQFSDVTMLAHLGDESFGQGLAVGDFNEDGFPDLYLGNVGENRLYRNNGDGTFDDLSASAGIGGDRWTTSCLIADLNGDALADLYEVNYLEGDSVYGHICSRDGRQRACSPTEFEAQHDRLFINLGDGRFSDHSRSAGILIPDGKGLGIVAADFEGTGQLALFVANDMTPNFYLINEAARGAWPVYTDRSLVNGLAYDRDGRAQACMGVAVDDPNHDGLLDLFVTNFYREHNTLYQQQSIGTFADVSRETGLKEPSFEMLGFGTQFLDGDLDGHPDLVVANGHVDDFSHENTPFKMRPQYFRNVDGRFTELPAATLGDYFGRDLLGRGLARSDINRDGREDFTVSHLLDPVALLVNHTADVGHFLSIELRGRASSRDAIGTVVAVHAAGQKWEKQLTAGDGYHASNQRHLVFGLGPLAKVDTISIRWPSGHRQEMRNINADQQLCIVEAQPLD